MSKQNNFVFWMVALVAVGLLTLIMVKLAMTPKTNNNNNQANIAPVSDDDYFKDNSNATVTIVEYSDFQCPACAQYYQMLKQVHTDFGDKIKFVYRHFPLRTIHPNAQAASEAAVAAGLQGRFWEMHDQLFENQTSWSNLAKPEESFIRYAENLGLNVEQFKSDLKSSQVKDRVNRDYNDAIKNGLNGTPTFFINGEAFAPRSYNDFANAINQRLNQ